MSFNIKYIFLSFCLILALFTFADAQNKKLIIKGFEAIGDSDYTTDDLDETCDGYPLDLIKAMLKRQSEDVGVNAGLRFVKELGKPNAFAIGNVIDNYSDGTVVIGKKLFAEIMGEEYKKNDKNFAQKKFFALRVLLYHELAHLKQNKENSNLTGKAMELDADYRAGFYMGDNVNTLAGAIILQTFEKMAKEGSELLFSNGDYAFNDVGHHGTSSQRLTSFFNGFSEAFKVALDYFEKNKVHAYDMLFFEGTKDKVTEIGKRFYTREFDGAKTRYVYFVLPLESKDKDKDINFNLRYIYQEPNNDRFCVGQFSANLNSSEPKNSYFGSCGPKNGIWEKGEYKVFIYADEFIVARGSFTVK